MPYSANLVALKLDDLEKKILCQLFERSYFEGENFYFDPEQLQKVLLWIRDGFLLIHCQPVDPQRLHDWIENKDLSFLHDVDKLNIQEFVTFKKNVPFQSDASKETCQLCQTPIYVFQSMRERKQTHPNVAFLCIPCSWELNSRKKYDSKILGVIQRDPGN